MIKVLGSLIVIFAGIGFGFHKAAKEQKRLEQGIAIKRMLYLLQGEIRYGFTPLPEAVLKISTKTEKEYQPFLKKAGKPTTITLLQQNSSGGFANIRLQSNNGKTEGILTTIYKEDGKFSVSEMVKYQVKKLELNEKNIMILEFYLSDQAELQTDGTMEFQCN